MASVWSSSCVSSSGYPYGLLRFNAWSSLSRSLVVRSGEGLKIRRAASAVRRAPEGPRSPSVSTSVIKALRNPSEGKRDRMIPRVSDKCDRRAGLFAADVDTRPMGSQANAFAWDPMGLDLGQSPVGRSSRHSFSCGECGRVTAWRPGSRPPLPVRRWRSMPRAWSRCRTGSTGGGRSCCSHCP